MSELESAMTAKEQEITAVVNLYNEVHKLRNNRIIQSIYLTELFFFFFFQGDITEEANEIITRT